MTSKREPGMKVAYLVNTYPKLSHTFIRREILGLESLGIQVQRISVRESDEQLQHPIDREEASKTVFILKMGLHALFFNAIWAASRRPISFLLALFKAMKLGHRSDSSVLRYLVYFIEACTVARVATSKQVTHLHVHFGTNSATVALFVHLISHMPYSLMIHGSEEFDKPTFLHLGLKIRHAKFVAVTSYFARSQAYRWCRLDDWDKIHVIRCGVDETFLEAPLEPVSSESNILSVGRLSVEKGHILLVRCAAVLKERGFVFKFVIVGDGPMRETLKKEIDDLGLADSVQLTGPLDESSVRSQIVGARCMVLPSLIEGLPVTMMEAMALGRPVIASRVAGIPELLKDNVNGWLITPGRVEELVEAVAKALETPETQLMLMGENGRKSVSTSNSSELEARKLFELLSDRPLGASFAAPRAPHLR